MSKCPDCGDEHLIYFSDELIAMYKRILHCTDYQERIALMLDFANMFADDVDCTSVDVEEDIHELVETLRQTRAQYEKECLKLARLLVHEMDSNEEIQEDLELETEEKKTDGTVN